MKKRIILLILIIFSMINGARATEINFKLPYPSQQKFILVNGYNTPPTHIHKDSYALDFTKNECEAYGMPAIASHSGVVSLVLDENKSGGYGYVADVTFDNGMITRYAHLIAGSIVVKVGDNIQVGQEIGKIGNSGLVMGNACPSYPGTHLHFAVYQKQADGTMVAYKPEPISGYTNLLAGNWYTSDNVVYAPVYADAGSWESGSSASLLSQSSQSSGAINSFPKESLLGAVVNGVENFVGSAVNKITSTISQAFSALKSSVADIFNFGFNDEGSIVLDNQSNSNSQPANNNSISNNGDNQTKSQREILNSNNNTAAQSSGDFTQNVSQLSSPSGDESSHSQPDINPAKIENQDLKNIQSSSTSPIVASSTNKNPSNKNNISQENSPTVNLSCSFNSGAGQIPGHQVLINEVAWMGSASSASDEWIEIKNVSGQEIDLKNWQLIGKDDDIKINFSSLKNTKIASQGFILLERTDDSSVPSVAADLIYSGSLANSDEGLRLFDKDCHLVDEVLASPNWPAGNNSTKQTMERDLSGFNWHTSIFNGGTPKQENSSGIYQGGGGGSSQNQSTNNQTNQSANQSNTSSKSEIVINEIMYNLEGSDSDREWIEIFNSGTTTVDLTDWKLYDGQSNHKLNITQGSAIISPGGYAIISSGTDKFLADNPSFNGAILESSFSLNNSGETLSLKDAKDNIIDQVTYSSSMGANGDGLSLQKINGDWRAALPTPGRENKISLNETKEALIASFTINPENPEAGQEVIFLASSTAPEEINYYQWDFENLSTSSKQTISTSSPIIKHIFDDPGNYEIKLSAFGNNSSSSYSSIVFVSSPLATSSDNFASSSESTNSGKVFISEIKAGDINNANDEFVELYNPTDQSIDLTNWSLQRQSSSSSVELKNLVSKFSTSSIAAKSFFLIASDDYSGSITPDLKYSNNSNDLAYTDDVLILKNNKNEIVDRVIYLEIPAGKSLERKAQASSTAQSMSVGEDKFLGNAYKSGDDSSDFIIQDNPNPQNSFSLPEPRNKPSSPIPIDSSSSIAYYDSVSGNVYFSWLPSYDTNLATSTNYYKILIFKNSSSTTDLNSSGLVIIETTSTTATYYLNEAGDFYFGVQAFDRDGLGSDLTYTNLFTKKLATENPSSFLISTSSSHFVLAQLAKDVVYAGGGPSDPSCQEDFIMPVDFSGNLSVSFILSINDGNRGANGSVYFSGNNQSYNIGTSQADASLPPQEVTVDLGRVNLQKDKSYYFKITPGHREIPGYGWLFHNFAIWGTTSTNPSFDFSPESADLKNIYFYLQGENESSPNYQPSLLSTSTTFLWEDGKYIKQLDKSVFISQGDVRTYLEPNPAVVQETFISPIDLSGNLRLTLYGASGLGASNGSGSVNPSLWFSGTGQTYSVEENWGSNKDIVVNLGTTTINKGESYTFRFNRGYLGDLAGGFYSGFTLYGSTSSQNYPNYFKMEKMHQFSWSTISSMSNLYFILENINSGSILATSTETNQTSTLISNINNCSNELNNADSTISCNLNLISESQFSIDNQKIENSTSSNSSNSDLNSVSVAVVNSLENNEISSSSSSSSLTDFSTSSLPTSENFSSSSLDNLTTSSISKVEPD